MANWVESEVLKSGLSFEAAPFGSRHFRFRLKQADKMPAQDVLSEGMHGSLKLDRSKRTVCGVFDGLNFEADFSKFPVLWTALEVICSHKDGLYESDLFYECYHREFHKFRHYERLASTLSRLRKHLVCRHIVQWQGGVVRIHESMTVHVVGSSIEQKKEARRRTIVSSIRTNAFGLSAPDLAHALNVQLRTLQLDLKYLSERSVIRFEGKGKRRKYFLKKVAA
jgi:hypothetical protein